MRRSWIEGLLVVLALGVARAATVASGGDAPAPPPEATVAAARARADAAAEELTKTLMERLTRALAEGGPEAAVRVCGDVAQDLTRTIGAREGLALRRTALRVRNPANAPDAFERRWLERAEAAMRAGEVAVPLYELTEGAAGARELRHLRPIVFPGGACTQCHGPEEAIPATVRRLLRARYPDDRATGFVPGDLRGAISVRVPLR
jgi:hypothetical protein